MALSLKKAVIGGAALLGLAGAGIAFAAGGGTGDYEMKHVHWHFDGMTGTYDKSAVQRGYQVYREVCAACHALEHLSFRHLGDKGGPYFMEEYPNPNDNPYIKAFAADWQIPDIDSETGDPIERPGIPADGFPDIYPNSAAAAGSNGGVAPPDLSVMVSARNGGADYVYNLLVAYGKDVPADVTLGAGQHYNPVMEGGVIAMAPPLVEGILEYAPQEINDHGEVKTVQVEATLEQMSKDVTEFLAWSADPKMEQRKNLGMATLLYLLIFTILMWFSYRRVWKDVEH